VHKEAMRSSNGRRRWVMLRTIWIVALAAGIASFGVCARERVGPDPVQSIILMIGDGMGVGQIEAARRASVGQNGRLAMDELAVQDGWARTADSTGAVTDSAASGTAIATGRKTRNGRVGVDASGQSLVTILELAQEAGKSVGLVTTVPLYHATPAVFASHVPSRYYYDRIAQQVFDADVDVLLGGGAESFFPLWETCACGWSGVRGDGRNFIEEAIDRGVAFVCDSEGLGALDLATVDRLLGLFAEEEMLRPLTPTLEEMTVAAIEVLSQDPEGFFLMVEGGLIDWVCHSNDAAASIELTIGFDRAVDAAAAFARDNGETLLIVTADHETGGMSVSETETGHFREDGPIEAADGMEFFVEWLHTDHTGADVPVRADGPFAERFSGTYENTRLFELMVEAFGFDLPMDE